jgi:hypothetical protein
MNHLMYLELTRTETPNQTKNNKIRPDCAWRLQSLQIVTLCSNNNMYTSFPFLVGLSLNHWASFNVRLTNIDYGYLLQGSKPCRMKHSDTKMTCWGKFSSALALLTEKSLYMSRNFERRFPSRNSVHFWVELKACKWPCCGHELVFILHFSWRGEMVMVKLLHCP